MTEFIVTGLTEPIHRRQPDRRAPDLGVEPPEWTLGALCAQIDSDMFFADKGGSLRDAKSVCGRCEVIGQCLDYALGVERDQSYVFGVYGGLSPRERVAMLRDKHGDPCPHCGIRFRNLHSHLSRAHRNAA